MQTSNATWQGSQIVSLEATPGPDDNDQRIEAQAITAFTGWLSWADSIERPPHLGEATASEVVARQQMAATADMDMV